ncbi:MAG: protease [Acidobacteria bacterium]|jgi:collagenase-like PrtC family protease|nr:protease [Acidobacteriota bacterium]
MSQLEFSVPYNNDPETLPEIFKRKHQNGNRIREIYLSGPQEFSGSGRIAPAMDFGEFARIVDSIHREGIRVNLLLNSICEGSDWYSPAVLSPTMDYLRRAHEDLGVEAVTIANPLYIREVRRRFSQIEICASVLGDIDCVEKAVVFRKAGADAITPDVDVNRNLSLLKRMKEKTGAEMKLMVNEGCLFRCAFRKFHFNFISHKSRKPDKGMKAEGNVFSLNCIQLSKSDPSQLLKSGWIRPEDARRYLQITGYFKLVGRTSSKSMVVRSLDAYMNESWNGDLLELMAGNLYSAGMSQLMHLDNRALDEIGFFEKVTSCDKECSECDYCSALIGKLIKRGVFTSEKIKDLGLQ